MTSWILGIKKGLPQHLDYARERGLWDLDKRAGIEAGDSLYFWQAPTGLVGKAVATTELRSLEESESVPWDNADAVDYKWRFGLAMVSEQPAANPRWRELELATGVRAKTNFGPQKVDTPNGEKWLAAQFATPKSSVDFSFSPDGRQLELESLLHDTRDRADRTIALRQGQPSFRRELLAAYERRCALTGCDVVDVLEAAHISPYLGTHTNVVSNGLLLRADVHTLFDRHLVTVTPDLVIRISPSLADGLYGELNGARAATPNARASRPSVDALSAHNRRCVWLRARSSRLFEV